MTRRDAVFIRVCCVFYAISCASANSKLVIGVLDLNPERARQLAAAAEAGLQYAAESLGGAARALDWAVELAPAEPDETVSLPQQVSDMASRGMTAVLVGGSARLAAAAAARAGVPLLAVDEPDGGLAWEALLMPPQSQLIVEVGHDLIESKGWQNFVLLHSGSSAAVPGLAPPDVRVLARSLPGPPDSDLAHTATRDLMLVLKNAGLRNFVVWGSADDCLMVLEAAQRAGVLEGRSSFLLLTLELPESSLPPYSYADANITTLMLFDPQKVEPVLEAYRLRYQASWGAEPGEAHPTPLLLAHDAAASVLRALAALPPLPPAAPARPAAGAAALHAHTLLNYVHSTVQAEAAGVAAWDWAGRREEAALRVAELVRGGRLQPVAQWRRRPAGAGLQWTRPPAEPGPAPRLRDDSSLINKTFTVLIAMSQPYVMRRESPSPLRGNVRYEGYCVELLEKLAAHLHFNYTLREIPRGWDYGRMLKELTENEEIDLAMTDLTVTAERTELVDFTSPFMNLGITILAHTPAAPEPKLFNFMLPFSTDVWVWLGVAYVMSSLLLWVVGRLCPAEWQNPHPCLEDPPALHNQFTIQNAFWFNIGALLLQGSEIAPVAYGSRAVASVWWLFALIVTSSYTANLATLLAKKDTNAILKSIQDLIKMEHNFTYGAKKGGSTYLFFKNSENQDYKKMFQQMEQWEMPVDNDVGVLRAMEDPLYAFLAESTTIEYITQRNCLVQQVGGLLGDKTYALALKKGSPYLQSLNLALLYLTEHGELREMKDRWWNEKHGGGACQNVDTERDSQELYINSFYGLFLVLGVGCAAGLLLAFADIAIAVYRRHRNRSEEKQDISYWRRLRAELRFVFKFERSVRPLSTPPISPSPPTTSGSAPRSAGSSAPRSPAASPARSPARSPAASPAPATRTPSLRSRRRRSSMHRASLRLARHATHDH